VTCKWPDDRVKGQSWVPEALFVSLLWRSDVDSARRTQWQAVQRPLKLVDARHLSCKQHTKTAADLDVLTFNWPHVTSNLWPRPWWRHCSDSVLQFFYKHRYQHNNKPRLHQDTCYRIKVVSTCIHLLPSTCVLYRQQNCCQFVSWLLLDTKG